MGGAGLAAGDGARPGPTRFPLHTLQARERAAAAAKKAEAKRLADEEDAAASRAAAKATAAARARPTAHQLRERADKEAAAREAAATSAARAARREVGADEHAEAMDRAAPDNRAADGAVDARSLDAAVAALTVGGGEDVDRRPEKRARAAFAAYSERELARLKAEKPGLKLSQYKDLVWRAWLKAPENPMVAAGRV